MISAIILTYNSEASIARTLKSVKSISDDIHVVDSYSTDKTLSICADLGCHIVQRPFLNYSDQRNWSIDNLPILHEWQIHIDADEELEEDLISLINSIESNNNKYDAYIFGRKVVFLGRVLRFGGIAKTWHCRIFRRGLGRCEDRLYDQHFFSPGKVGVLNAFMLDHQEATLSTWTAQHNRWSDLEAAEVVETENKDTPTHRKQIKSNIGGNKIEKKRYIKHKYYAFPLFFRSLSYFLFRYFFLLGFLDGKEGLIYHVLQGFWFRFLVDAKIYEKKIRININN